MLKPNEFTQSMGNSNANYPRSANGLWKMIEPNGKNPSNNKKDKNSYRIPLQSLPKEHLLSNNKTTKPQSHRTPLKTRHIAKQECNKPLQTLKSDFEMLHMKEDETINTFTTKLTTYLQIVASIEQYSDLSEMTLEEAIGRLKTYEERIKYKGKQVDNQDRLLFTRYEEQGRRHGHGGSNQSQGQESNFKKETHNNSNKLTHDKSKIQLFCNAKSMAICQTGCPLNKEEQSNLLKKITTTINSGVGSKSLDGGITESMNQPGIKEDIHSRTPNLEVDNNQTKTDQPDSRNITTMK
ncbi:hypothetical protein Tco_0874908 [Tanacetum coccineum]|uniref:Zinc finger, CCHC-type n=1 Tax=Tanacetum coccineum TaxID=301880 RepID=A0ABQ5BQS9_9ASTR